ncbi:type II toxin-antitoxin system VapC family toxin [Hyperthermus butylicus]|uniref:PIN domain-containing protein n=1 Tax=Hyperthermus butylicus (strain DSM 5456 / JCM 9403 / PLM1-5) TaxID=415426 RepID=A2BKH5_HYPBU|nr:PIN domain-containing protein [Hyperthermus butylicus]ABM80486.1 hypothetical protein Hbut_0629 [Hyperthermus butylicus DSM 5456]
MARSEKAKKVIIDTYTLLAMAYGELSSTAASLLEQVRERRVVGIIPVTVAYEYLVHWHRGRIPVLKTVDEVVTFLTSYFKVERVEFADWVKAAEIKSKGDQFLRNSSNPLLRQRRLSIVDSTVIALALRLNIPILTGDKDLAYVAEKFGVPTLW